MNTIHISGMGWVLPGSTGSGTGLLDSLDDALAWTVDDNRALDDFSAKAYLNSVKGYLDPASSFCLAACALAMQTRPSDLEAGANGLKERSGIATATRFGATLSGFRFFQQLQEKGVRYASPLVFPHSYPNTAGNLAAMEFEFGGPHMVYYGSQDLREAMEFAAARLTDGSAEEMLITAYESADTEVLGQGYEVMHGAVALYARSDAKQEPLFSVSLEALRDLNPPTTQQGMTAAMLQLLGRLDITGATPQPTF